MKSLRFLGNEILLGTLIAVLSVFTAVASAIAQRLVEATEQEQKGASA